MKKKETKELFSKLEMMIESDFNENEVEERAYKLLLQLETIWEILELGSMIRWAEFEDEERGIEIAENIVDKAIEKAVKEKNQDDLRIILDELKMSILAEVLAPAARRLAAKNI